MLQNDTGYGAALQHFKDSLLFACAEADEPPVRFRRFGGLIDAFMKEYDVALRAEYEGLQDRINAAIDATVKRHCDGFADETLASDKFVLPGAHPLFIISQGAPGPSLGDRSGILRDVHRGVQHELINAIVKVERQVRDSFSTHSGRLEESRLLKVLVEDESVRLQRCSLQSQGRDLQLAVEELVHIVNSEVLTPADKLVMSVACLKNEKKTKSNEAAPFRFGADRAEL